ncbi:MAG TPA: dual specificity protein phosphatase [Gemmataceae bacterium]|nr:dual specificity protein phosphatase [Gemmataceae bacterium]
MRRIADFPLWIGHVGDVRDPRVLLSTGIRAAIDLALNEPPAVLPRELVYCRFPLIDGAGNPPWLLHAAVDCVANFLRSGTPTLVYCGAGMSRSPCIVAAAIAGIRGCSADEALMWVAKAGAVDVMPGLWAEVKASHLSRGVSLA